MLNPSPKGCLVTQHIIDQLTTIRRRKISIRGSLLSRFISYLLYIFLCWGQNHQIIVFIPIHLAQSPAIFYTREWIHHKKNMVIDQFFAASFLPMNSSICLLLISWPES